MSQVYIVVFLTLLLSFNSIRGENHFHTSQSVNTYIISVKNNLKPTEFSNTEEWYKSILSKTNSNPKDSLIHVYDTVFHGFSARLRPDQANHLRAQVEVNDIFMDQIYQLHTTRTPHFLGLDTYKKPEGLIKDSDSGSDIIVGVFDSGIWPESPSFHDHNLSPVPIRFKGECKGGKDFPPCNKKIVGVRYFNSFYVNNESLSARDDQGHGTHTASIIAGRDTGLNTSFFGYAKGEATGIAPMARLSIYKVCWQDDGCSNSDILAAFDTAVKDGVDIISLSLGGSPQRYDNDAIAIGAFGALQRGVFVSASAGNDGPEAGKVTNGAPWITTIGASTIDRKFPADVILDNGQVLTGSSLYTGNPLPKNKTFPLIHFPSDFNKKYCLSGSLNKKLVKGKIVICLDYMNSRFMKGVVVEKAGGKGVIVVMNDSSINYNDTLTSEPFLYPGVTLPYPRAMKLMDYIRKKEVKKGTIVFRGTQIGKEPAPVVSVFSSRGPNKESFFILKPDVIAPGVDILAAWPDTIPPTESPEDPRRSRFNIVSGTSMSCPHVSGIAALLKGAHKDWSPAQIRSALMTTAYRGYHKGTTAQNNEHSSPWEIGAGHVDPEKAHNIRLVYDLSEDDYIDNLCATGYKYKEIQTIVKRSVRCKTKKNINQWDLNYPAIVLTNKLLGKTIVKRLTSLDSTEATYTAKIVNPKGKSVTVSPLKLTFKTKGEKQSFSIQVQAKEDRGSVHSDARGSITWTDGNHDVTIPLVMA